MPEISQEDLDICIEMIYRRWTEEFDLLKKVKNEKSDGSDDWHLFHTERLKNHTETERIWNQRRMRLSPLHSLVKKGD